MTNIENLERVEPAAVELPAAQPDVRPAAGGNSLGWLPKLALGATIAALVSPSAVEAFSPDKAPSANEHQTGKCPPHKQISFQLAEAKYNTQPDTKKYKIVAESCEKTKPKLLKHVRIIESNNQGQKKSWKYKKFEPNSKHERYFKLPGVSGTSQTVTAKALGPRGKRLGTGKWNLNYKPNSRLPQKTVQPVDPSNGEVIAPECNPDPDFSVGIQDDSQFVWQQDISRDKAFDLATSTFGAKILRINVVKAQVDQYGYQQYEDAVDAAVAHGYKVQVTITQTPSYMTGNAPPTSANPDPEATYDFAKQTAAVFGQRVMLYSIYNEPNYSAFLQSQSLDDYLPAYRAGDAGVLAGNPNAKVMIGELAPSSTIFTWLAKFQGETKGGVAIHSYGDEINHLVELKQAAGTDLYDSEYGIPASDPDQMAKDQTAIKLAKCAGLKEIVFFQLIRRTPDDGTGWDTGVINLSDVDRKSTSTPSVR
jgi:hypothetical protein